MNTYRLLSQRSKMEFKLSFKRLSFDKSLSTFIFLWQKLVFLEIVKEQLFTDKLNSNNLK